MRIKKVGIYPNKNKSNKYLDIITSILNDQFVKVIPFKNIFKYIRSIKNIHLNWYENINPNNSIRQIVEFGYKILILILLKLCGKSIIWTMHNRRSHNTSSFDLQYTLMKFIIFISDTIVIHSKKSKEVLNQDFKIHNKNIVYTPHPNYIDVYGKRLEDAIPNNNKLNLLFIGAIKPYKGIELLIDLVKDFPNEINITIAGEISPSYYREEIVKKIKVIESSSKNLFFTFKFIPDKEIPILFSKNDLLILPYDQKSALNSGTLFLAFSYSKTAICPLIGSLQDFEDLSNFITYEYSNDHYEQLKKALMRAIEEWQLDKDIFKKKGRNMYEIVKKNNNNKIIGDILYSIYK